MAELKFSSHFRSEEMVVPRNLNDFTSSTTSPAIVSGTIGIFPGDGRQLANLCSALQLFFGSAA